MAGAPINNTRACRPVHRLSLTARQAVYVQSCRGVSYRVVLVPIFPGLVGSTWELARVASSPGRSSAAGSVPPAAQRLAGHLRLIGRPSVGNLPRGNAGPWTIWAQPSVDRASRILSTGPLGARGQFDYFDIAAEPGREGRIRDEPCHRRRRLVRPAGGSGRLGRLFPGPASG
jgi:hypothetical protein